MRRAGEASLNTKLNAGLSWLAPFFLIVASQAVTNTMSFYSIPMWQMPIILLLAYLLSNHRLDLPLTKNLRVSPGGALIPAFIASLPILHQLPLLIPILAGLATSTILLTLMSSEAVYSSQVIIQFKASSLLATSILTYMAVIFTITLLNLNMSNAADSALILTSTMTLGLFSADLIRSQRAGCRNSVEMVVGINGLSDANWTVLSIFLLLYLLT